MVMKKDVITRRGFFKRTASVILPTLAAMVISPLMTSCEIEDDLIPEVSGGCKNGCSGKCSGVCGAACQSDCTGSCTNGCKGNCRGTCSGSGCRSLCTGRSKY